MLCNYFFAKRKFCCWLVNWKNYRTVKKKKTNRKKKVTNRLTKQNKTKQKNYRTTGPNEYCPVTIVISLCSRSLLSLQKPESSRPKGHCRRKCTSDVFVWQYTQKGMVSFCWSSRNKNANDTCGSIQMWYKLVRLVERWTPHSGRWWSCQEGLL